MAIKKTPMRRTYVAFITLAMVVLGFCTPSGVLAQQDAQYTQYVYNTLTINPAYAGSRGGISALGLHRSQWVGLDGAPRGDIFATNQADIDNRFAPQLGVGLFYYTDHFYLGASAPNLLQTEHFDESENTNIDTTNQTFLAEERVNYYLTAGYVFDITQDFKFKPAGLIKAVAGAPLQVDVTANVLLYDKLTLGLAYRWSAAFSGLAGFQLTDSILLGLAYDREKKNHFL